MSGEGENARNAPPTCRYEEFLPPAPFAEYLLCTWVQSIGAGDQEYVHRIFPDGCVDVVWVGDAPPRVVGPTTAPSFVVLPPGTIVVGARFRPAAASAALRVSAADLLDEEIPLNDVWGRHAEREAARVTDGRTLAAKLAAMDVAIVDGLKRAASPDRAVLAATDWLAKRPASRVSELESVTGLSARQLQRRFVAAVGYGPKTFQRVLRFQRVLDLGRNDTRGGRDLASLALDAGFADQAHMTREFQDLSGLTPGALVSWIDSTLRMSDFFKKPDLGRG